MAKNRSPTAWLPNQAKSNCLVIHSILNILQTAHQVDQRYGFPCTKMSSSFSRGSFSRRFGRSLGYGVFQIFVNFRLWTMAESQQVLSTQSFHADLGPWTGFAVGGAVLWGQWGCFHCIWWTISHVQIFQTLLTLILIFDRFLRHRRSIGRRQRCLVVGMDIVIGNWRVLR